MFKAAKNFTKPVKPATRNPAIRVEISGSNLPRFDRNPNTGHQFGMDNVTKKAAQTAYHDKRYPSFYTACKYKT